MNRSGFISLRTGILWLLMWFEVCKNTFVSYQMNVKMLILMLKTAKLIVFNPKFISK